MVSRFPAAGPFRGRLLAANGRAALLIGEIRREARQGGRKKASGLGRFLAKPAPAVREEHAAPPQPVSTPAVPTHIAQAVQFALDAHGPLPTGKLSARQRRAVLRKLSAAAVRCLNQEAWSGMAGETQPDRPAPSRKTR